VSQEEPLRDELAAAQASIDALRAELEAERRKAYGRRARFDVEVDRLEARLARAERLAAERREALALAQAQLRRPVVRVAAKGMRILDRLGRSIGGGPRRGASAGPTDATAVPAADRVERVAPAGAPASIAIHIAPPNREAAATWGDTHFAQGLQRAFERQGWTATVHIAPEADDPRAAAADVALHLFGRSVPPVRPGQPSILWVISHPDRLRARLADTYDLVFVASDSFAAELATTTERPVRPLHQATDPERFHPDPSGPRHELLFVGNSRGARRPILDALAGTNHDLAVYGGAWTPELLDPKFLRGPWIPNEELHRYYAGADIVLNDHWADMAQEGFISNRVFDVLASGGFVVSDAVTGMGAHLDESVATYDTPGGLVEVVDHYLAHPAERAERAARGRAAVLAHHTFDHRATAIIDATRALPAGARQRA
jgi:hypothetical protein